MAEDTVILDQKESIKLMKMSKGYQWEIKLLSPCVSNIELARIQVLDDELRKRYGDMI